MRTTLSIDDDVLRAARLYAAEHKISLGEALSELARRGISQQVSPGETQNGVVLLPVRPGAKGSSLAEVNDLRDEIA